MTDATSVVVYGPHTKDREVIAAAWFGGTRRDSTRHEMSPSMRPALNRDLGNQPR